MATFKIKQVRSTIGTLPSQRKTMKALGLRKIGQVVEKQDNPQMRGMVEQVKHLVQVVE